MIRFLEMIFLIVFLLVKKITEKHDIISYVNIKPRRVLKGHHAKVLCASWSLDKRHLVSSSQDGKVIVWDAFTNTKVNVFHIPTSWLISCAFSPSGKFIACG